MNNPPLLAYFPANNAILILRCIDGKNEYAGGQKTAQKN